jgi:hypothetical protein
MPAACDLSSAGSTGGRGRVRRGVRCRVRRRVPGCRAACASSRWRAARRGRRRDGTVRGGIGVPANRRRVTGREGHLRLGRGDRAARTRPKGWRRETGPCACRRRRPDPTPLPIIGADVRNRGGGPFYTGGSPEVDGRRARVASRAVVRQAPGSLLAQAGLARGDRPGQPDLRGVEAGIELVFAASSRRPLRRVTDEAGAGGQRPRWNNLSPGPDSRRESAGTGAGCHFTRA